jgi:hypothetical protein
MTEERETTCKPQVQNPESRETWKRKEHIRKSVGSHAGCNFIAPMDHAIQHVSPWILGRIFPRRDSIDSIDRWGAMSSCRGKCDTNFFLKPVSNPWVIKLSTGTEQQRQKGEGWELCMTQARRITGTASLERHPRQNIRKCGEIEPKRPGQLKRQSSQGSARWPGKLRT